MPGMKRPLDYPVVWSPPLLILQALYIKKNIHEMFTVASSFSNA